MKTWVINASPLILLGKINRLDLLQTLLPLLKAKVGGHIPRLKPEIDLLLAVGSLLSPSVIQQALFLAGEHV